MKLSQEQFESLKALWKLLLVITDKRVVLKWKAYELKRSHRDEPRIWEAEAWDGIDD